MNTSELLQYVAPGTQWSLVGEPVNASEYKEALTWFSEGQPPTWAALKNAEAEATYAKNYSAVEETRRAEYTLNTDPLFFSWQRGEKTEQEWLDAVQAVKDANPYPVKPSAKK